MWLTKQRNPRGGFSSTQVIKLNIFLPSRLNRHVDIKLIVCKAQVIAGNLTMKYFDVLIAPCIIGPHIQLLVCFSPDHIFHDPLVHKKQINKMYLPNRRKDGFSSAQGIKCVLLSFWKGLFFSSMCSSKLQERVISQSVQCQSLSFNMELKSKMASTTGQSLT
jgi:hypothetical protein